MDSQIQRLQDEVSRLHDQLNRMEFDLFNQIIPSLFGSINQNSEEFFVLYHPQYYTVFFSFGMQKLFDIHESDFKFKSFEQIKSRIDVSKHELFDLIFVNDNELPKSFNYILFEDKYENIEVTLDAVQITENINLKLYQLTRKCILSHHPQLLESVLDAFPQLIFITDNKGVFVDYHKPKNEGVFLAADSFLGNSVSDFFSEEISSAFLKITTEVLENGDPQQFEYSLTDVDGKEKYFLSNMSKLNSSLIISSISDITYIVEARNEYQRLSTTHLDIINSLNEALYILNEKWEFIYVNKAAENLYGYSKEYFMGKTPTFLSPIGMNDHEMVNQYLVEAFQGIPKLFEFYGLAKDGRVFPKDVSLSLVNYFGKKAVMAVGRDITRRKGIELELESARDKAKESDRLKSTFLATLSHELRTPLNVIIGFSDLIKMDSVDAKATEYAEIIYNRGRDLQHIIEDTLDLAMIESGQLKIRRTQKKIADYFSELDSEIQQLYSNSNVGVVKVIDENIESEMLSMDHTKLNQIFFNLIKNAIKYTPSGFVHYGISNYTRHMVEFFVEDTGVGIDPQYHELIFKSFRQINDGISREHGGLGLGLAIIKGLVEYMGGKVRVVSELNQGATFYFNLPH